MQKSLRLSVMFAQIAYMKFFKCLINFCTLSKDLSKTQKTDGRALKEYVKIQNYYEGVGI